MEMAGWFSGLIRGNKLSLTPVNLVTDIVTANKAVCALHMPSGSDMIKLMKHPFKGCSADTSPFMSCNWVD